jgi:hypothetical protein
MPACRRVAGDAPLGDEMQRVADEELLCSFGVAALQPKSPV